MEKIEESFSLMNLNSHNSTCLEEPRRIYNNLSATQKSLYSKIQNLFKKCTESKVLLLESPSGSGKTFLLRTLGAKFKETSYFIAFRKDQATEMSVDTDSFTHMSFNMHHYNLIYHLAKQMFNTKWEDPIKDFFKLLSFAKQFAKNDSGKNVIILDMYTVFSPAMICLLYLVCLYSKMNLILAGNKMQICSISKSTLHKESNFLLAEILADSSVNELKENLRHSDIMKEKVLQFYEKLTSRKDFGNVPWQFDLRYELFRLFREKYFTEERMDTLFIAYTHRELTVRSYRFIEYLKSVGMSYVEEPFYYVSNKLRYPLPTVRKGKFYPCLLLVPGYKYFHVNVHGFHEVVILEEILFNEAEVSEVWIRFAKDNHREKISKCMLNHFQILETYRSWLLEKGQPDSDLFHFPLRPYTLTYHSALGRTIIDDPVELSVDCTFANFAYVGISCVRRYSDIHKIHTPRDLLSYALTHYMETTRGDDKYYFRSPTNDWTGKTVLDFVSDRDKVDNIVWKDTEDVTDFERKKSDCWLRIPRAKYEKACGKSEQTELMRFARFAKDNPTVICDTIRMITPEDVYGSKTNNNNRKKKNKNKNSQGDMEYVESKALLYFRKKYAEWTKATKTAKV